MSAAGRRGTASKRCMRLRDCSCSSFSCLQSVQCTSKGGSASIAGLHPPLWHCWLPSAETLAYLCLFSAIGSGLKVLNFLAPVFMFCMNCIASQWRFLYSTLIDRKQNFEKKRRLRGKGLNPFSKAVREVKRWQRENTLSMCLYWTVPHCHCWSAAECPSETMSREW